MIVRLCVVIPVYNNTATLSDVVKDVVLKTRFPVLIVDDGSQTPATDCLYSWDVKKAMAAGRVRVVRFPKNQGKGAALQFAIRDLVQQGFTHMLTMDGGGQHLGDEVVRLAEQAKSHPWSLTIGHRRPTEGLPWMVKLGRQISNFWVSYQTGFSLHDSRSGFRLYPLFNVQGISCVTRKHDWDLEILMRLLWKGSDVREIEVEVASIRNRISLTDHVRMVLLFVALALITLIKGHRGAGRLAVAIGLGAFIGMSPWLEWHGRAALLASLLLRMNGVAMWVGTWVSAPFLVSWTMLASIYVGQEWFHVGLNAGMNPHFKAWLAGFAFTGVAAGVVVGALSFLVLRAAALTTVPARVWGAYRALTIYGRRVRPAMGFWPRQRGVIAHAGHLLRARMDDWYAKTTGRRFTVHASGLESLTAELGRSGRANALSANLCGIPLASRMVGISTNSIVHWRAESRPEGKIEWLRFFGHLAPFDVSAFAAVAGVDLPLFFIFGGKDADGYRLEVRPPKSYRYAPGIAPELQLYAWMEKFVGELEAHLIAHPEDWANLQDIWSEVPRAARGPHLFLEELPLPEGVDAGWTQAERVALIQSTPSH